MTIEQAIRKLEHAADRLIPACIDRYEHRVSLAFGCGKDELSSRVQAGVICRLLANELTDRCQECRGLYEHFDACSQKSKF